MEEYLDIYVKTEMDLPLASKDYLGFIGWVTFEKLLNRAQEIAKQRNAKKIFKKDIYQALSEGQTW